MEKKIILISIIFMTVLFPLKLSAQTTKGQIQFYEPINQVSEPPKKGNDTKIPITQVPTVDYNTEDLNKNKQFLLQTNDTLNYGATLFGSLLFFYAIYKIRRNEE